LGLQVVVVKGKFYRKIEGMANGRGSQRQNPKPTTGGAKKSKRLTTDTHG
jgi:hypothetical protein